MRDRLCERQISSRSPPQGGIAGAARIARRGVADAIRQWGMGRGIGPFRGRVAATPYVQGEV
ncbi:MAG TPA: hypothetical protein PJ982_14455, partial [Lacipirellulaceae bacterium]|nr:hypothetical protein [Lacipirellulaceae bacterium]